MDWQLIESDAALRQVLAREQGSTVVAVDTEFMRRNTFFPQVALLQLCFSDRAWLVDPLAIEDTQPIADLMVDSRTTKVLHSASEDLEVFQCWLGVLPSPLFDTQRAAALVDLGFGLGYRALVQEICDVDLPKGETRSDWLQRPLTEAQCEYAAQDVAWLLPVWQDLYDKCITQDKLDWVLADGADAAANLASNNGEYYKRIKTAWKLNARQLSVLRAVCDWREATARRMDKPRSWIIDDKACLQLAQYVPASRAELRDPVGLPPPAVRRYGEELLSLLNAQRDIPDGMLPPRLPGPLQAPQRQQLKQLRESAREIASRLGMAPEALLQSRDYEALLRESRGEALDECPRHWTGWREQAVIEPLRRLLAGAAA